MKNAGATLLAILIVALQQANTQTVFWQDNFENAALPDVAAGSTRTPENNSGTGGPPNTSYFKRTNGSDINVSVSYAGFSSSFFWAGEDHDTPFGAGNEEQQIEWTGINISGKSSIVFSGLFGANSTSGSWDNFTTGSGATGYGIFASPSNDYIVVQYAIDAGPYINLISFFGDDITGPIGSAKNLKEDTNGDFIGDGTTLNKAMAEFSKAIPGTGTTMKLRIRIFSNGGNEEWGIDNFRLASGGTLPLQWLSFNGNVDNTGRALISWKVEEVNIASYQVEKSQDGILFTEIGNVTGKGDGMNTYIFKDVSPVINSALYRIRQTGTDGRYTYSPVIRLQRKSLSGEVRLFPMPVSDNLGIIVNSNLIGTKAMLYDDSGRYLKYIIIEDASSVTDFSTYPKGIYWLKLANNQVKKIIKQ